MRVLVFEQWFSGHHLAWVRPLIDALLELQAEVVLAVSSHGRGSPEFKGSIEPIASRITIDDSVPVEKPWMPMRDRPRLFSHLRRSVDAHRPAAVYLPSGDGQSHGMAAVRFIGRRLPRGVLAEAGLHIGMGPSARTRGERAKTLLYEAAASASTWDRIHFVNVLLREHAIARFPSLASRSDVLPVPILPLGRVERAAARTQLGIPVDGRYIGLAASLDDRKAIDRLLAAFRDGATRADDRLLLAGRLHRRWRELIQGQYRDLLDAGRIQLIDRFLSAEELGLAASAVDVVCPPYPDYALVSATVLEGLASGRPVLAARLGWSQAIVERFGIGWTCDMHNPREFAGALGRALDKAPAFTLSPRAELLRQFNTPENFAACLLAGLRQREGMGADPRHLPWAQVAASADA